MGTNTQVKDLRSNQDIVSLGDAIKVSVLELDVTRKRIQLTAVLT